MVHTLWKEAKTNKRFKTQGYYIIPIKIYVPCLKYEDEASVFKSAGLLMSAVQKKRDILSYFF